MPDMLPTRGTLYSSDDLLKGFDRTDNQSFVRTWDFEQFMYFVGAGGAAPTTFEATSRQAAADAEIGFALRSYIRLREPAMVGVMGSHNLPRDSTAYLKIVELAKQLTLKGYLVVTGGGPGAMEAGHVGAAFAHSSDNALKQALVRLKRSPKLPKTDGLVGSDGTVNAGTQELVGEVHAWMLAALEARDFIDGPKGESLAVPTWLYGQEPTTPFATAYAKFFQNSIREETLIANGSIGMLYARGGGGTLREIFQDVERNYYIDVKPELFVPMIFVDPENYWRTEAVFDADGSVTTKGIKLDGVLDQIFHFALPKSTYEACKGKLLFSTNFDEIDAVLNRYRHVASTALKSMLAGDTRHLLNARRR